MARSVSTLGCQIHQREVLSPSGRRTQRWRSEPSQVRTTIVVPRVGFVSDGWRHLSAALLFKVSVKRPPSHRPPTSSHSSVLCFHAGSRRETAVAPSVVESPYSARRLPSVRLIRSWPVRSAAEALPAPKVARRVAAAAAAVRARRGRKVGIVLLQWRLFGNHVSRRRLETASNELWSYRPAPRAQHGVRDRASCEAEERQTRRSATLRRLPSAPGHRSGTEKNPFGWQTPVTRTGRRRSTAGFARAGDRPGGPGHP